jgi:hypothetical protein
VSLRATLSRLLAWLRAHAPKLAWHELACPGCGCSVEPDPGRWSEGFWSGRCWWRRSATLICDASSTRVLRVRSNGDGTVELLLGEGR